VHRHALGAARADLHRRRRDRRLCAQRRLGIPQRADRGRGVHDLDLRRHRHTHRGVTGRGRPGLCTGPSGPRGRLDFPVMTFLPRILSPLALVAAGGLLLGACSSDAGSDTDDTAAPAAVAETVPTAADLSDAVYDLSEITGHTLVADSTVELVFDSGTVSVHAGCNRMCGAFSIDDGALETPQLAATLMACDQALMDQDQWMAGFLE